MAEVVNFNLRPVGFNPVVDDASDTVYILDIHDAEDNPCDLTGYTAKMDLRPYPRAEAAYDELTTENGRLKIDGSKVEVHFPASVTATYDFLKACYDLLVMYEGKQWRVAQGVVVFSKEVTANVRKW